MHVDDKEAGPCLQTGLKVSDFLGRDGLLVTAFGLGVGPPELALEAQICSRTDIFSEPRIQRSKHGNNCARSSSEQQDMLALG